MALIVLRITIILIYIFQRHETWNNKIIKDNNLNCHPRMLLSGIQRP